MDYNSTSSSNESKKPDEKKKLDPVVKGPVKTRKKSEIRKFADVFVSEDINNVKSYILMDVLIPAFKKAVSDVVTNGIDMILYGSTGKSRSSTNAHYVSYNDYSRRDDRGRPAGNSVRAQTAYSYDDIAFNTRGEAEDVLTQMEATIDKYGFVTIADMYDLANLTSNYTDNKYGWMNVRNAEVIRARDGYVIKLPRAVPID